MTEHLSPAPVSGRDASDQQQDTLSQHINDLKISDEEDSPRAKLRSWLGELLRIVITDERIIVGRFVCTDRDGNIILENSFEYTSAMDGEYAK